MRMPVLCDGEDKLRAFMLSVVVQYMRAHLD
jgi:hypothetical protein